MAAQLKGIGYSTADKDRLRQRLWIGKNATRGGSGSFEGLMATHDADRHTSSTHGTGESGVTDQRNQLDIWIDTLIINEKEARRKRKEQEDLAAGRKNADAEAAKATNAAFGGKNGRRGRRRGGAAASASGTPMPPDISGAGSTQQSTGSGHSASHSNSWGWADPSTRPPSGKFTKHPRLSGRPFSMTQHVQKAYWTLSDFHSTYFSEHEAPALAPTSMADQGEVEIVGFKVVTTAPGVFAFAPLHRHDPAYKFFLSEQEDKAELVDAFDEYEAWRAQQPVPTIAAVAILISEGLDARPPAPGRGATGASEIAALAADLKASAEAQATAMTETQNARNVDREAQRAHEKEEAAAARKLERERMAATQHEAGLRHEQVLAMLVAAKGGGAAAEAPAPPPPPPESGASVRFTSLEELLADADASAHAGAFSGQEYTLTNVYAAFDSEQLMEDLKDLIPVLGVRRRVMTSVTRGRQN